MSRGFVDFVQKFLTMVEVYPVVLAQWGKYIFFVYQILGCGWEIVFVLIVIELVPVRSEIVADFENDFNFENDLSFAVVLKILAVQKCISDTIKILLYWSRLLV